MEQEGEAARGLDTPSAPTEELVEEVFLQSKQLETLPDFSTHVWMQTLVLSFNKLSSVQGCGSMVRLRRLDLSHNQLSGSLPSLAPNAPVLEFLDISFNALIDLKIAQGCRHLTQLRANANSLHSLEVAIEVLSDAPSLAVLTLHDNPIVNRLLAAGSMSAPHAAPTISRSSHRARAVGSGSASGLVGGGGDDGGQTSPLHVNTHVNTHVEAAAFLIAHRCESLKKLTLCSPLSVVAEGRNKGSVALIDGGNGQCSATTAHNVMACITDITPSFLEAAHTWASSPAAAAFAEAMSHMNDELPLSVSPQPLKKKPTAQAHSSSSTISASTLSKRVRGGGSVSSRQLLVQQRVSKPTTGGKPHLPPLAGVSAVGTGGIARHATTPPSGLTSALSRISEEGTRRHSDRTGSRASLSVGARTPASLPPVSAASGDVTAATTHPSTASEGSSGPEHISGEIEAAEAVESAEGYRVTYSGRVLGGALGEGAVSDDDGQVALRVYADGTAECRWPHGGVALEVSADTRAASALQRYQELMAHAEAAPKAFRVIAQAFEADATHDITNSSGSAAGVGLGTIASRSVHIDGFGVGKVASVSGATLLEFKEDGSGYHADRYGIVMRRWNALGVITYASPTLHLETERDIGSEEGRSNPPTTQRRAVLNRRRSASCSDIDIIASNPDSFGGSRAGHTTGVGAGFDLGDSTPRLVETPERCVSQCEPDATHAQTLMPSSALSPRSVAPSEVRSEPLPDDERSLRETLLADLFPSTAITATPDGTPPGDSAFVARGVRQLGTREYIATAVGCGFTLGRHMAVMYNLTTHELKLYIACKAFRYELVVASSTGSSAAARQTRDNRLSTAHTASSGISADGTRGGGGRFSYTPHSSSGLHCDSPGDAFPISLGPFRAGSALSELSNAGSVDAERPIVTPKLTTRAASFRTGGDTAERE